MSEVEEHALFTFGDFTIVLADGGSRVDRDHTHHPTKSISSNLEDERDRRSEGGEALAIGHEECMATLRLGVVQKKRGQFCALVVMRNVIGHRPANKAEIIDLDAISSGDHLGILAKKGNEGIYERVLDVFFHVGKELFDVLPLEEVPCAQDITSAKAGSIELLQDVFFYPEMNSTIVDDKI